MVIAPASTIQQHLRYLEHVKYKDVPERMHTNEKWFSAEQLNHVCTGVNATYAPCQQVNVAHGDLPLGFIAPFRPQPG